MLKVFFVLFFAAALKITLTILKFLLKLTVFGVFLFLAWIFVIWLLCA